MRHDPARARRDHRMVVVTPHHDAPPLRKRRAVRQPGRPQAVGSRDGGTTRRPFGEPLERATRSMSLGRGKPAEYPACIDRTDGAGVGMPWPTAARHMPRVGAHPLTASASVVMPAGERQSCVTPCRLAVRRQEGESMTITIDVPVLLGIVAMVILAWRVLPPKEPHGWPHLPMRGQPLKRSRPTSRVTTRSARPSRSQGTRPRRDHGPSAHGIL